MNKQRRKEAGAGRGLLLSIRMYLQLSTAQRLPSYETDTGCINNFSEQLALIIV